MLRPYRRPPKVNNKFVQRYTVQISRGHSTVPDLTSIHSHTLSSRQGSAAWLFWNHASQARCSSSMGHSLVNGRNSRYPAVLQEVADNIEKYPGCVILTKVGGFYELYFDQARELGVLLNLKVAERKYAGGKVPMVID